MIGKVPLDIPIWLGMRLYLTQNIDKDIDFVNGMKVTVEAWNEINGALRVVTETNSRIAVYPWTHPELKVSYYCVRPGYASTILKMAGTELEHVTIYLDAAAPGAAYTALSRVAYGDRYLIAGDVYPWHFKPQQ